MARISLEMTGRTEVTARLERLERNLSPSELYVAYKETMAALEMYTRARWGEGVHVTESTEVRWPDWQPLYRSGALKQSLTQYSAPGSIRLVTPYGFSWGSSIPYAGFLQRGTKKMKPKPVIRDLRALRGVVGYSMRKYILKGVSGVI